MKTLQDILVENTLYTQATKAAFVGDPVKIASAFMFNFIGFLGMMNRSDAKKIFTHLKSDKQLRLTSIGDDNNDISLIIKLMADAKFFKNSATPNDITRFLVLLKAGTVTHVNSDIVHQWCDDLSPAFIQALNPRLKAIYLDFRGTPQQRKTVGDVVDQLKKNANRYPEVAGEFAALVKTISLNAKRAAPKVIPGVPNTPVPPAPAPTPVATIPAPAPKPLAAIVQPVAQTTSMPPSIKPLVFALNAFKTPAEKETAIITYRKFASDPNATAKMKDAAKTSFYAAAEDLKKRMEAEDRAALAGGTMPELTDYVSLFLEKNDVIINVWDKFHLKFKDTYAAKVAAIQRQRNAGNMGQTTAEMIELARYNLMMILFISTITLLDNTVDYTLPGRAFEVPIGFTMPKADAFNFLYEVMSDAVDNTTSAVDLTPALFRATRSLRALANASGKENLCAEFEAELMNVVINISITEYPSASEDYFRIGSTVQREYERANGEADPPHKVDSETYYRVLDSFDQNPSSYRIDAMKLFCRLFRPKMYTDHMVSLMCIDSYGYSSKDPAESKRYRRLISSNDTDRPWAFAFRRAVKQGTLTADEIGSVQTVVSACMDAIERTANDPKEQLGKITNYMAQRLQAGMYSLLGTSIGLFPVMFPYFGALMDAVLDKYFKGVDSTKIVRSLIDYPDDTPVVIMINNLDTVKPYDKTLIDFAKAHTKKLVIHIDSVMAVKDALMKYDPANDPTLTYLADNFVNTSGNTGNSRLNVTKSLVAARQRMTALGIQESIILATEIRIFELACENANTDAPDATIVQPITGESLISFFQSIDAPACSADQLRKILKTLELPKVATLHKKVVAEKWNGVRGKDSAYSEFVITIVRTLAKTDAPLIDKFFEDLNDNNTEWKVKNAMVGAEALTTSIEKDVINPFVKVDQKTLNMVLKFNNLTFEQVAAKSGLKLRKQTGEKFGSYMKRVADAIEASKGSLGLESLKVAPLDRTQKELDRLTVEFTKKHHSGGKHGNCYVKILREFDVHLPSKDYEEYLAAATKVATMSGFADEIRPAFHGTGGLAAMMILRYGFAVIKPTPGFTVGRMLGDGIYFSNTIDKTAQYVGNSGFTRKAGIKGYMFDMRNILGPHDPNNRLEIGYRSAGVGADAATRSPEWCVRNPQKQLKIFKCYEVQLIEKYDYDNIQRRSIVEDMSDTKMTFKDFLLTEADEGVAEYPDAYELPHQARFTFWDGEIPVMDPKTQDIEFYGFDEMPEGVLPPNASIELSGNGPMVVFTGVSETVGYDVFTGRSISGEISREYFDYSMKGFER